MAYKVLIVDDEADIRDCVEMMANRDDLIFDTATTGQEGLAKILVGQYDCVVSDIKMPEMTGTDMLKKLREAGNHTPIVFISGFANDEFAHTVSNYGAVKLLHKLELNKIRERILEAIELGMGMNAIKKGHDAIGEEFINLFNDTKKK